MRAVDGITAAALQRLFEATTELVADCEPGSLAGFPMAAEAATDLAAAILEHFHPVDAEERRLEVVKGSTTQGNRPEGRTVLDDITTGLRSVLFIDRGDPDTSEPYTEPTVYEHHPIEGNDAP